MPVEDKGLKLLSDIENEILRFKQAQRYCIIENGIGEDEYDPLYFEYEKKIEKLENELLKIDANKDEIKENEQLKTNHKRNMVLAKKQSER